jgi:hypothetical protein
VGPWLLVAAAAGLVLFGGFSFLSARWGGRDPAGQERLPLG